MKHVLPLVLVIATACASPSGPTGSNGDGTPRGLTATLIAAGDIGMCGRPSVAQVANLVSTLPGDLILAGDIAYFQGTAEQFRDCFNASWGGFRSRWHPVPGNHEYESPGAAPYFAFFGEAAGPPGRGYYAFTAGDWLILMLDSNIPATTGSPQYEFVRVQLQGQKTPCTMAVWHHPLFTSGPGGPARDMRDMWALLEMSRAEVIVSGHDHLYERFARQRWDGTEDPVNGVRQFIVGTGGADLYTFVRNAPNSEERILRYGVARFTLRPAQVEWEFIAIDGTTLDQGLDTCR